MEFTMEKGMRAPREMLVFLLNTGTYDSPVLSPLGIGVSSSDMSYDVSRNSSTDIFGTVRSTMKTPTITQSLDPWPLEGGDAAAERIAELAIIDQDVQQLANMDIVVAHLYTKDKFAERYPSAALEINRLGGDGGGDLTMGVTAIYGGTTAAGSRIIGTVSGSVAAGFTFTPKT